ncbi:MAG: hypothetical protein NVS3B10_07280 [Polyangiales bacterium]
MLLTPLELAGVAALAALAALLVTGVGRVLLRTRLRAKQAIEQSESLGFALAASEAVSAALSEEALFLSAVLSGVDAVIIVSDRAGRVRFINERFEEVFGVRAAEVLGRPRSHLREMLATSFADPESFRARDAAIDERRTAEGRSTIPSFPVDEGELVLLAPTRRVLTWSARPVVQGHGRIGVVVVFQDVTRQREAEEARTRLLAELAAQARTDALTGLANRRHAAETLTAEVDRGKRYGRPLAVVLFDLDHFKMINDDFGHQAGDAVLRTFGDVLRASARGTDVVARWGGEEFLAILHEADADAASAFADRVRVALAATKPVGPHLDAGGPPSRKVTVTARVAALGAGATLDAEALVRRADAALYDAKNSGRDRVARAVAPATAPDAGSGVGAPAAPAPASPTARRSSSPAGVS